MKAVKDEASGEMVAHEVLDAAVITARFRNVAERHGRIDLRFEVIVPAAMQDRKWQLRFYPDMFIMEDSLRLEPVIITGAEYRRGQLRGYEQYNKFLQSIINDTTAFIDLRNLEIFIKRNLPDLYSFKTDSTYVPDSVFRAFSGVTEQDAIRHYTNRFAKKLNERRKANRSKMYAKYVALYAPVLIIALMALAQLKLLMSNKFKYSRKDDGFPIFLASIFIGIVEIMVITGTALNVTNIEKAFSNSTNSLIVFIVMSLSAVALILSDKKSKASGQGRTAYFASPAYFIESLVPSAVLLVIGMMQGNKELAVYSAVGVGISVLPCVCAIPIKRISDYYEVSGLVFGIIAGIIVFLAG